MANFLLAPGSSLGIITSSAVTLASSELVSLASSVAVVGATVFVSSGNFGKAIWAEAWVTWGGSITPAAGGYISGWWLKSPDAGTTFESNLSTSLPLPRSPDWIIPLSTGGYTSTNGANTAFAQGFIKLPWQTAKAYVQNNAGAAFPSSTGTGGYTSIFIGPTAIQY